MGLVSCGSDHAVSAVLAAFSLGHSAGAPLSPAVAIAQDKSVHCHLSCTDGRFMHSLK